MVNISHKIFKIENMINNGDYFVINKPRQYGKTTMISRLAKSIESEYLVLRTTFEGSGDLMFQSEEVFSVEILDSLADNLEFTDEEKSMELRELSKGLVNLKQVSKAIGKFVKNSSKKVVLIIDEVDKFSNNQLFLSFLGMIRSKFLMAREGLDYTFHSVILAGVHDVQNLKIKLRDGEEMKLNSPWNIAVKFNVDMSFNEKEIETMLMDYCEENNVEMNTKLISEKLYYYTSGYPFLVSKICKIIDELILSEKKPWNIEDINKAIKILLKESNTLFDDLKKNLENNQELNNYIFDIVFNGSRKEFNIDNPLIYQGHLYGILKDYHGIVKVSNRIYEQRIYNYFTSKLENTTNKMDKYNFKENFIDECSGLNMEKVLKRFQQFMREQYSRIDEEFIEREGRLLFLAFIKPIINGVVFDFKEVQISEEKRLDIVITYNKFKYIIELKIWNGPKYHEKGLKQLYNYMENQEVTEGYLLIYNFNKNKEYTERWVSVEDKRVFEVYV